MADKVSLVTYIMPPDLRRDFIGRWEEYGFGRLSRAEEGCVRYDLSVPTDKDDELFLTEYWRSEEALDVHKQTGHYKRLIALREELGIEKGPKAMAGKIVAVVTYTLPPEKRREFLVRWAEFGISDRSRAEDGCSRYDLSVPVDREDRLYLIEYWDDERAQTLHRDTEHYRYLTALKEEFSVETLADIFNMQEE